jgi:hypothetical protein
MNACRPPSRSFFSAEGIAICPHDLALSFAIAGHESTVNYPTACLIKALTEFTALVMISLLPKVPQAVLPMQCFVLDDISPIADGFKKK